MANAIKKVDMIRQIVQLKQMLKRWKALTLRRRESTPNSSIPISTSVKRRSVLAHGSHSDSSEESDPTRRVPAGFLAVYVGAERCRFVIPTRYLNFPVFVTLLQKAEEEFGFQVHGGLVLPCEVGFFEKLLKILEKDEQSLRRLGFDEVLKMFSDVGSDPSCKELSSVHGFTPLLQKTRV